ncbi:MAG: hypothetical protein L6406_05495, partial [Desulfobacterales bacterium]|nr:hypothetical protein [Desulfobacterales bacterium]
VQKTKTKRAISTPFSLFNRLYSICQYMKERPQLHSHNLREALQLHFEDDPDSLVDFAPHPSLFTMMDLGEIHV